MSNIFIKLGSNFVFKREALETMIGQKDLNDKAAQLLDTFFDQQDKVGNQKTHSQYSHFLMNLISSVNLFDIKDKLTVILVYFVVTLKDEQSISILSNVIKWNQPIVFRVKVLSLVFKSSRSSTVRKWLIANSVDLIQKEPKISFFSSFVENFDSLMGSFGKDDLSSDEAITTYCKLVSYLQKHLIYKKLWPVYLTKALRFVTEQNAQNQQVSGMIVKIIKSNSISEETLKILNHQPLNKNRLFPLLEIYLTGDFQNFHEKHKQEAQKEGLNVDELQRKMKIQSIPRLFTSTKLASYQQIATMLQIKKDKVQGYIIEAIRDGIIKAKLDEFQETVLISRVNFRCLRGSERARLQKDLTTAIEKLGKI